MLRDVLQAIDYSFYAEVALILFLISFMCIVGQMLWTRSSQTQEQAQIPLQDGAKKGAI